MRRLGETATQGPPSCRTTLGYDNRKRLTSEKHVESSVTIYWFEYAILNQGDQYLNDGGLMSREHSVGGPEEYWHADLVGLTMRVTDSTGAQSSTAVRYTAFGEVVRLVLLLWIFQYGHSSCCLPLDYLARWFSGMAGESNVLTRGNLPTSDRISQQTYGSPSSHLTLFVSAIFGSASWTLLQVIRVFRLGACAQTMR